MNQSQYFPLIYPSIYNTDKKMFGVYSQINEN